MGGWGGGGYGCVGGCPMHTHMHACMHMLNMINMGASMCVHARACGDTLIPQDVPRHLPTHLPPTQSHREPKTPKFNSV